MSRIIRCDRCHKDIDINKGGVGYIAWNWRHIETDDLIDGNPFEHMDFCEGCMAAVKQFVMEPCACERIPEEAPIEIIACTETSDKCAETVKNEQISEENAQISEKSDSEDAEEDEDPQPEPQKKKAGGRN